MVECVHEFRPIDSSGQLACVHCNAKYRQALVPSNEPTLLPCPFCAGEVEMAFHHFDLGPSSCYVKCWCGARGTEHQYQHGDSKEAIAKARGSWNRRSCPATAAGLHIAGCEAQSSNLGLAERLRLAIRLEEDNLRILGKPRWGNELTSVLRECLKLCISDATRSDGSDAARYRFLRLAEPEMGPEQEQAFGEMWLAISQKGCWKEAMDARVDAHMAAYEVATAADTGSAVKGAAPLLPLHKPTKVACKKCDRHVKAVGLDQHMRDKHGGPKPLAQQLNELEHEEQP